MMRDGLTNQPYPMNVRPELGRRTGSFTPSYTGMSTS
jgi:hypothetical protein